ncbi:N-acetylneuraminate synthase family protein [Bordetella genomosp. 13]|uniref:N-acetylneuraminate synthase n=1 Tax=Bordetella genomosp. 13 TaxID=463040 RepID=A0A1W6ZJ14_9BORD|nr:N-acetylneuraminate synthase family protein [Bordetella genomosp. 13]ARP97319.1 N-acetylneuraminate synthase [Bordetella genomosp. 13]
MEIEINGRKVGDGQPAFVIAEIGSNHNQDYDLALRMIDAALMAGADAVKFQTFKADRHVSRRAESPSYLKDRNIQDLLRSLELNRDWQAGLQAHTEGQGGIFFSSPCDFEAVDGLEAIGAPAHKVASFDLTDTDLIGYIARTGKPMILSTGLADWMDIQRGIDTAKKLGNDQLVLLQCTSLYPAPPHLSNLRAMDTMRHAFGVLTGYSDHTLGSTVSMAAVARGACMIEKHFTLDRTLPGPDHSFAMEPQEFSEMVRGMREIESALGDGSKNGPRPEEQEMAEKVRRSLHAARDIEEGEKISADMLVIKRPGHGLAPFLRPHILGRTARRRIEADEWITWDMV